jgi:hypothetical protein
MRNPQRLAGVPFLIHRHEHGKPLMRIASDKLFHIAAAPPCAWGFARSLRKTPLQRFHSIIIGSNATATFYNCRVRVFASKLASHRSRDLLQY